MKILFSKCQQIKIRALSFFHGTETAEKFQNCRKKVLQLETEENKNDQVSGSLLQNEITKKHNLKLIITPAHAESSHGNFSLYIMMDDMLRPYTA